MYPHNPTQIGIAYFHHETLPDYEQWQKCMRSQAETSTLWLSATSNTLDSTKQYATGILDTLPIIKVDC